MVMGLERLESITAFIDEASEAGLGDMAPSEEPPDESEDSYLDASATGAVMLSQRSGQLPQQISVEQQVGCHGSAAALQLVLASTDMQKALHGRQADWGSLACWTLQHRASRWPSASLLCALLTWQASWNPIH